MQEYAVADLESARKPASNSLIGLHVIAANACECGTKEAVVDVGCGPHPASLQCAACTAQRGWLGHRTHDFLGCIVRKFGRPAEPIVFRRAIGRVQSFDLMIQPPDGAIDKTQSATRRRTAQTLEAEHRSKDMALGKRKTGGDFLPVLKYDARIGEFYQSDRVFSNGEWETEQHNIQKDDFRVIFDLHNTQIGWIYFPKGSAPETVLVPAGQDPGDAPSDKHKEGVRVVVKMADALGGDVRELMSTAVGLWNGIDQLHDEYLAAAKDHPGELPVVILSEIRETKTAAGTSCAPIFAIADWVPRPRDLPLAGMPPPVAATRKPATLGKRVHRALDEEIPF